jgi:hypothetical protein
LSIGFFLPSPPCPIISLLPANTWTTAYTCYMPFGAKSPSCIWLFHPALSTPELLYTHHCMQYLDTNPQSFFIPDGYQACVVVIWLLGSNPPPVPDYFIPTLSTPELLHIQHCVQCLDTYLQSVSIPVGYQARVVIIWLLRSNPPSTPNYFIPALSTPYLSTSKGVCITTIYYPSLYGGNWGLSVTGCHIY